MGHAGLVGEEGGQVDGLLGVVLGEGLCLSAVALGALLRVEAHGAMARRGKLAVRLKKLGEDIVSHICSDKCSK